MTDFEKRLKEKRESLEFRARRAGAEDMRAVAKAELWSRGTIALDDTGVVRALRFACTGCGKCCDTPPSMHITEALRLADRFVLKAELRSVMQADPDNPFDQHDLEESYREVDFDADPGRRIRFSENLAAQARALGISRTRQEGPTSEIFLWVLFTDLMDEVDSCPMRREDGFCSIYGDRPSKCRLVPFDESIPLEDAGDAATIAIMDLLMRKDGKCQVDRTAPIAWEACIGRILRVRKGRRSSGKTDHGDRGTSCRDRS